MLKVNDLFDANKNRKNKAREVYKRILLDVYKKIKNRNEYNATNVIFRVPLMMLDAPLYDIAAAVKYVSKKLREGGFKVIERDNVIQIDWKQPTRKDV